MLDSFRVEKQKALRLAECTDVPSIMVIAGPNGVGKSTLLWALKQGTGVVRTGHVLYLSAHRIWRRQQVRAQYLLEQDRTMSELLALDSMPNFGNLQMVAGNRGPDSADEAFSATKFVLAQLETRRQTALSTLFDRRGRISKEEFGDVYEPLREVTRNLLPHLSFKKIDLVDRMNVRCVFERVDSASSLEIDLDDLSSGERSVVSLFMPFIEAQVGIRLAKIEEAADLPPKTPAQDLIVIIDEPEIHLHPQLQAQLLLYLRSLVLGGGVQFIIASHSPTLLNAANFGELFVLTPPTDDPDWNQLRRPATSEEKLDALRTLCGDTQIITSCRRIICTEGEGRRAGKVAMTDVQVLTTLIPELQQHVLVPCGGKSSAIATARRLREILASDLPITQVLALVDADQEERGDDGEMVLLPVAMIENLLLSAPAIWEVVRPQAEALGISGADAIQVRIDDLLNERRDDEVRLRVQAQLGTHHARLSGKSADELRLSRDEQLARVNELLPGEDALALLFEEAAADVEAIVADGRARLRFHGKDVLRTFHQRYLGPYGIGSFDWFASQVAAQIARAPGADPNILEAIKELRQGLGLGDFT